MAERDRDEAPTRRRPRGRPPGGGNTSQQAKAVLMDAAERSILERGFHASTMEIIANEAGYSRAAIYQHFPDRRTLLEALVARKTRKHQIDIGERLPKNAGLAEVLVESLVIVATELVNDPLLKTLSDQTDDGTIAFLVANDPNMPTLVEQLIGTTHDSASSTIRAGLSAGDVGQFIVTTALTLLLDVVPGIRDPDTARRYLQTFVLPAILEDPPPPHRVFEV